jgi:hypothetical protein
MSPDVLPGHDQSVCGGSVPDPRSLLPASPAHLPRSDNGRSMQSREIHHWCPVGGQPVACEAPAGERAGNRQAPPQPPRHFPALLHGSGHPPPSGTITPVPCLGTITPVPCLTDMPDAESRSSRRGHWRGEGILVASLRLSKACPAMPELRVTNHREQAEEDRRVWRSRTPEQRLDEVERLRLEAGKVLYEYPARLRRLLSVAPVASR